MPLRQRRTYTNGGAERLYADRYRPRDSSALHLALTPDTIESSGGTLTRWADLSGNGHHGTPAGSPAVSTASGVPCVVFDGSNDVVDGALAIPDQPYTLFLLRQNADTSPGGRKWLWDTSDTGAAGRGNGVLTAFSSAVGRQEVLDDPGNVGATTTTNLEVVRVDFSTKNRQLFVNGAWKSSSAYPGTTVRNLTTYRLGARSGGGSLWAGNVCAVLLYAGTMTQKEKERIEGELMDLAGIARPFAWTDVPEVSGAGDPRLILPDVMHCIAGRSVRIGKWNCMYWTGRYPGLTATSDLPLEKAPARYWKVTPPAAGDYEFTVAAGAYSKTTILRALDMPSSVAKKYVLCVGDSRTHRGGAGWVQYVGDILGSSLIGFVGNLGPDSGYSYKYYGVDSKTWGDFDSTALAFYNGGVIDIAHYRTLLAHDPDIILWSLGQNDVYSTNDFTVDAAITTAFGHVDNLLGAWTAELPNVKHMLAYNWPLALDPAIFGGASSRDGIHRLVHRYVERLQATYGGREAEKIYLIPRTYTEVDVLKGVENDGIHENRSPGHDALAEAYLAALVAYGWS